MKKINLFYASLYGGRRLYQYKEETTFDFNFDLYLNSMDTQKHGNKF